MSKPCLLITVWLPLDIVDLEFMSFLNHRNCLYRQLRSVCVCVCFLCQNAVWIDFCLFFIHLIMPSDMCVCESMSACKCVYVCVYVCVCVCVCENLAVSWSDNATIQCLIPQWNLSLSFCLFFFVLFFFIVCKEWFCLMTGRNKNDVQ